MLTNEFKVVRTESGWKIDGDGPAGLQLPPVLKHLDRALLAIGLRLLRIDGAAELNHVVVYERVS
jgi:hypothetical protein